MNKTVNIKIPYGKNHIRFSVPSNRLLGALKSRSFPQKNIKRLVSGSVGPALRRKLYRKFFLNKKSVLIVVPDATRKSHLRDILPCLIKGLKMCSGPIDIIVATGLHKEHTEYELKSLLGANIVRTHHILSHSPGGRGLHSFGVTGKGIPIILNKNLKKYDAVISVGVIEPHLYAGYSGGAKTIAIGLAGEAVINATHSTKFLDDPMTAIGVVENNAFQDTLWEIMDRLPGVFSVNVVNDCDGNALRVFSGDMKEVFRKGVDFSRHVFEVRAAASSDIVICGIGHPKDMNLYQASRAINYILNVDKPILKKGGALIVAARLGSGIGSGKGEKRFYEELKNMASPVGFIKRIKREGCIAGVHRAYMVAKPLLDYHIIFVTNPANNFMKNTPFPYFEDIRGALRYADSIVGRNSKIHIVPRALSTIVKRC